jgi:hypothetical protein
MGKMVKAERVFGKIVALVDGRINRKSRGWSLMKNDEDVTIHKPKTKPAHDEVAKEASR